MHGPAEAFAPSLDLAVWWSNAAKPPWVAPDDGHSVVSRGNYREVRLATGRGKSRPARGVHRYWRPTWRASISGRSRWILEKGRSGASAPVLRLLRRW